MSSAFVLNHARIWVGDGRVIDGHVEVRDGFIKGLAFGSYRGEGWQVIDLEGAALSPGLIDVMCCGGFNFSLVRDDPLEIARRYLTFGVTTVQNCLGALPYEKWLKAAEGIRRAMLYTEPDAAQVAGFYPEGMFLIPRLAGGSQGTLAMDATPETIRRVLDDMGDVITTINVSPGIDRDVEAVRAFVAAGKRGNGGNRVSMAHSDVPAERVYPCLEAGTTVLGHVWNNNQGSLIEPGVQQPNIDHVGLTDPRIEFVHLICDGTHVHPTVVQMVVRCRGLERICLATDCCVRAGLPDGPYTHNDGRAFQKMAGVGRTATGQLAGSGRLLPDDFRNFVKFTGLPPYQAIRVATYNPACHLRMQNQIGLIAAGYRADLLVWDDRLQVKRIWRAGRELSYVSEHAEVTL